MEELRTDSVYPEGEDSEGFYSEEEDEDAFDGYDPEEDEEEYQRQWQEDRRRRAIALRRVKWRKRRAVLTILLVVLLFALAGGAGLFFYVRRSGSLSGFSQPYATSREFSVSVLSKDNLRADTFAQNLCVTGGDVACEGVSLPNYQEGLLLNLTEKTVLYAQDPFVKIYPASLTKLVTAIIALEYGNLADVVTITAEDLDLE